MSISLEVRASDLLLLATRLLRNLVAEFCEAARRVEEPAHEVDGQKERAPRETGGRPVTAPRPVERPAYDSGAHRVEHDVAAGLEQVIVVGDRLVVVRPLE